MNDVDAVAGAAGRLDVMNFLNEMAERFPDAISFAAGRPAEAFFQMDEWLQHVPRFAAHFARQEGIMPARSMDRLAQYGRTNGVLNALVAQQVARDEGIMCTPGQVLMATGCQEAIDLCVTTLCRHRDDVVLVRSPTYIGVTGVADLNGIEIAAFSSEGEAGTVAALTQTVEQLEARGKRARVLYLIPTFDNPTGEVLSRQLRLDLIDFCASRDIVILEDNPYGMFRYDGEGLPSMFALDRHGCVIYLGTYSKTLCPSLRVGFAILPARLAARAEGGSGLLDRLSQAKSFITVNTSQITQAIVGAVLLEKGCSLREHVGPAVDFYRSNRDAMTAALERHLADLGDGIRWNVPEGGFFLTVTLPFEFREREAQQCASDYGVLVMPLSFFALDDQQDRRVRLAFSNGNPDLICEGVRRFSHFVRDKMATG